MNKYSKHISLLPLDPCTFADTVGLSASVSKSASCFFSTEPSTDEGIKKVKQPGVRWELDMTFLLGYGTTENSMGGGIGAPVGPSPNPFKT